MEVSQRIHFWYQILLKMMIFLENGKKTPHFFGRNFLWQANKNRFELNMPKLLENHVKTHVQELFFLKKPNLMFFEFLTKKCKKCVFLEKKSKFWLFLNNSKNLRLGEKTKKKNRS